MMMRTTTFDEKLEKLDDNLFPFGPFDNNDLSQLEMDIIWLKSQLKVWWTKCSRKKDDFLKQNESWLNMAFNIPKVLNSILEDPQKLFSELSKRSKRWKTKKRNRFRSPHICNTFQTRQTRKKSCFFSTQRNSVRYWEEHQNPSTKNLFWC